MQESLHLISRTLLKALKNIQACPISCWSHVPRAGTFNFQGCFVPAQFWVASLVWPSSCFMPDLNHVRMGSFLTFLLSRGAGVTPDPRGLREGARSLQGALGGSCPCTYLDGRLTSHILSKPGGMLNTWAQKSVLCLGCGSMWQNSAVKLFEKTSILLGWETAPGMSNCSSLSQAELGHCWNSLWWGKNNIATPKLSWHNFSACVGREGGMDGGPFSWGFQSLPPKMCGALYSRVYWNSSNSATLTFWEDIPCGLKS